MTDNFKFENLKYLVTTICDTTDGVLSYLKDTFKAFSNALVVYIIACVLFYMLNSRYAFANINNFFKSFRRVLIVIAHPDDECMFFGPLIVNILQNRDCNVHLLCLSNGDHYKLGSTRKQELWDSCETLGISPSNIYLSMSPFMQDDPTVVWRKEEVAKIILQYTDALNIDTLVTFDEDGVSGHYNHISVFNAVCLLVLKNQLPRTKVYVLESVNLLRKYTNCMDALLTYLMSDCVCQIKQKQHYIIQRAMEKHKSQYVWFRKLYIKFSRYAYINSFRLIDSSNSYLEMDDFVG